MTKEQLIEKLLILQKDAPSEDGHYDADMLLLEYINDPEITKAFEDIEKWYA